MMICRRDIEEAEARDMVEQELKDYLRNFVGCVVTPQLVDELGEAITSFYGRLGPDIGHS